MDITEHGPNIKYGAVTPYHNLIPLAPVRGYPQAVSLTILPQFSFSLPC